VCKFNNNRLKRTLNGACLVRACDSILVCLKIDFNTNRQFQLLVYACRGGWEVSYHIADYAEKIKMVAV
jgi:hypothetical protein